MFCYVKTKSKELECREGTWALKVVHLQWWAKQRRFTNFMLGGQCEDGLAY